MFQIILPPSDAPRGATEGDGCASTLSNAQVMKMLKSIIEASSMTFDGIYTQSQFLNDVISVLNDFGFGFGFEIGLNSM